jgi:hypothetical protein
VKCRKCERPAVINMRRHRLALCQFHFPPWFVQRTLQTIEKYNMFTPRSRVLVAVSGGKDSLALWDVLLELNYAADGLTSMITQPLLERRLRSTLLLDKARGSSS